MCVHDIISRKKKLVRLKSNKLKYGKGRLRRGIKLHDKIENVRKVKTYNGHSIYTYIFAQFYI